LLSAVRNKEPRAMAWSVLISDALSEGYAKIPSLEVFDRRCQQHDHHEPFDAHTLLSLQGLSRLGRSTSTTLTAAACNVRVRPAP